MPKSANKKTTARAMRDKLEIVKEQSAAAPDTQVDDLVSLLTARVPHQTREGKAIRRLLPQIQREGMTLKALQAVQTALALEMLYLVRTGKVDAAKGHIQIQKCLDGLRQLVEADKAPIGKVPARIEVVASGLPPGILHPDGSAGDPIVIRSGREPVTPGEG